MVASNWTDRNTSHDLVSFLSIHSYQLWRPTKAILILPSNLLPPPLSLICTSLSLHFILRPNISIYRVIKNDCWGFNNLSYTIHLRQEYVVAPMDQEILKVFFYVPALPASISEPKVWIRIATETITTDMLWTVWYELDYRVDVCRITKGAHIEHL